MCGFPVKHSGFCDFAMSCIDVVDPESPLSLQNGKVTFVGGPPAGASPSASKLAAFSRLLGRFYGERGCKRAGQSPKNFPTHKIFLPHIPGLGAEVFHPFNSLRSAQLNRFPINKTAGRGQEDFMGRAQPFAGCLLGKKMCGERWGLLCSAFFTRKIFHAADRRDYELEKAVFLPVTSKSRFWGWG